MLASLLQGGGVQQTEHRNRNGEMVQMRGMGGVQKMYAIGHVYASVLEKRVMTEEKVLEENRVYYLYRTTCCLLTISS